VSEARGQFRKEKKGTSVAGTSCLRTDKREQTDDLVRAAVNCRVWELVTATRGGVVGKALSTNRKVAGSRPDDVKNFPSGSTMTWGLRNL
jgi:hypothetical protein